MNDEVRQIREEIFNRLILGIVLIGMMTGIVAVLTGGLASPWFIPAVFLLLAAVVAVAVRLFGRLVVASYVLVGSLVVLVVGMFLQPNAVSSFIPYLLIPVVVIAGFLLSPLATMIVSASSIVLAMLIVAITGQLSATNLILLLPAFGLTLIVAFLMAESKRYIGKLGDLLAENRKLLKDRTLEGIEAKKQVERLSRQVTDLQRQQSVAKPEVSQGRLLAARRDSRLYELINGTLEELRTSIETLEASIEQVGELLTNNGSTELLKSVWYKIDHLKSLIVNLTELVPLEYGSVKLNYGQVNVARLIGEAASTAQGLARGKSLEIRHHAAEDLPVVQADPVRLRQVLLHLLQNAIKFTDQGIIEIQAEVNDNELLIFISDTGIGMHREEAGLIFEGFGRGSGTLAQQRQGTGLGLAISKRLVELHGGRIWVTSVLGIGSTFYVSLPLEIMKEQAPPSSMPHDRKPPAPLPAPITRPVAVAAAALGAVDAVEGTTIALPRTTVAPHPVDRDETILSRRPSPPPPRYPEQPIHRYSPTYIRRFGFILLGLLLIVIAIVAILAVLNPPVAELPADVATSGDSAEAVGTTTLAGAPTSATSVAVAATLPTSTSTLPAATATLAASVPVQTGPTHTPAKVTVQPAAETLATSETVRDATRAILRPVETQTDTPTPTPTQTDTPTPTPTATPSPTATVAPPAVTNSQELVDLPKLTFVDGEAGQHRLPGLNLGDDDDPNLAIDIIENSRLSWSSTGQVLFAGDRAGNRNIFVSSLDNGPPRQLTSAVGDDLQPAWSPDGRKIAFSSGRTGNLNIYVMDADGRNLTQLTDSLGFDEWPVWAPDGQQIAFVSDRDGNVELYRMNADGSAQLRLTNHPADDWPAAWSPDGRWLAFASERDEDWNLFVIPARGGSPTRITNAPGAEREPVWSPDGQSIAFAYNISDNWDVYTLRLSPDDFTEIPPSAWTQITNTPADERYPVWSK
jgi:signal transduction histidine kinase